ncbi:hypothetical protein [Leptospira terpstrae]|uniref:Uncharacterized protein n=1 Tax=Leptospira terpstrae serovar Hualin str. LT 11-33 = ATCC 700639 TaxID=1257025 RepID=N1VYX7_9LEPT|nr:hypothetical protein [Leptospira terpstrae]EMY62250.1 hypothetical protein LEP1GSC203_2219 [Leptospira terpstrae serovar Hualin str. LT 11-33 = ATCC 700639]
MENTIRIIVGILFLFAGSIQATDVTNQDSTAYTVKVQGEGNLSISTHNIAANGTLYGLCGYTFCSFEIPGHKVNANRDGKLTIRNGKFVQ